LRENLEKSGYILGLKISGRNWGIPFFIQKSYLSQGVTTHDNRYTKDLHILDIRLLDLVKTWLFSEIFQFFYALTTAY